MNHKITETTGTSSLDTGIVSAAKSIVEIYLIPYFLLLPNI